MLNQLCLVGRLVSNPEIKELENKKVSYITLACNRNYKNSEGVYETDFIDVILWNDIAKNTVDYCKKGDLIGIRGRLESATVDDGDGHYIKKGLQIIAERVSFLSSRPANDNGDNA